MFLPYFHSLNVLLRNSLKDSVKNFPLLYCLETSHLNEFSCHWIHVLCSNEVEDLKDLSCSLYKS